MPLNQNLGSYQNLKNDAKFWFWFKAKFWSKPKPKPKNYFILPLWIQTQHSTITIALKSTIDKKQNG